MTHEFHAIASGEKLIGIYPVENGNAQSAFDKAEARCEAYRREFKAYAYVREFGYDETPEERQERAASEQARLAELIAADPCRDIPLVRFTRTAKKPRRLSERELRAMGLECAAEFRRLYGKDN